MSLDDRDLERKAASIHAERIANWKGVAESNRAELAQQGLMDRGTKEKAEAARQRIKTTLRRTASADDAEADMALSQFLGEWDAIIEEEFDYSDMDTDDLEESIPNRPKGAEYFFDKGLDDFSDTIVKLKENEKGNKVTDVRGIRAACKVMKTRYAKPFESVQVKIPYDTGMDPYSGLLDLFEKKGIIVQQGNRLKYIGADKKEIIEFRKNWTGDKLTKVMKDFSNLTDQPEEPKDAE